MTRLPRTLLCLVLVFAFCLCFTLGFATCAPPELFHVFARLHVGMFAGKVPQPDGCEEPEAVIVTERVLPLLGWRY